MAARPVMGSGMGSRGQLGGQFARRPSCAIRARLVRFYRFRADRQVRQPADSGLNPQPGRRADLRGGFRRGPVRKNPK